MRVTRTICLVGLAAALVAVVGPAQAGPATKNYRVGLERDAAAATYTLTVRNDAASTHSLGSADVYVPAEATVVSVGAAQATGGRHWSAALGADARVIELRAATQADVLAPGEQAATVLTLQVPCSTGDWLSRAKQSNSFNGPPGNDFDLVGGSPVVSSAAGAATAVEVVEQPTMTEAGTSIAPAVQVKALDACGNPAAGDVTVAISTNPSGGSLTGAVTQTLDAQGIATFGDLRIDKSGNGYVLSASSGSASTSSAPFNVVDRLCRSALVCEATDAAGTTTISTAGPPAGGAMGLSFGAFGSGFACAGVPSFRKLGSLVTIDPHHYTQPIAITTRWAKSIAPGTGVANFVLCWSKTGLDFRIAEACTKKGQLPAGVKLCELKRNRNGVGDLVIDFLIHPTDPYAGLGD